jgi:biotin carboxylase
MGLSVVGTDANPKAPALRLADRVLVASTRSPEETIGAITEFEDARRIAGVVTIANDVPKTVSRVAEHLGLPGTHARAAEILSDKSLMKSAFLAASISTPKQWEAGLDWAARSQLRPREAGRYVVKPTDGRGSVGVLVASSGEEISALVSRSARESGSSRFVMEEFVEGKQYSVEGIVVDSRFHLAGVAERNYDRLSEFAPHIIEDGGDISELPDGRAHAGFAGIMQAVAEALELDSGPLKGDLVVNPRGDVQVIEVAGRLSGGWFASHQIPYATGVDLMGLSILQALGEDISKERLLPSRNWATSIRYWFPRPGRIGQVSGLSELENAEGVLHFGVFRKEGEIQPPIMKHADRFGFVLTGAQSLDQARKLNQEAMSLLEVTISD